MGKEEKAACLRQAAATRAMQSMLLVPLVRHLPRHWGIRHNVRSLDRQPMIWPRPSRRVRA